MPYTPTTWVDGVTPVNATNLNKLENGLAAAGSLAFVGDWAAGTYQDGDTVVKDGVAFLCVGGPTSTAPDVSLWGLASAGATIGTALPSSPIDGQEFVLVDSLTAPTYAWTFKYVAGISDANKWVYIGGSGATSYVETDEGTASASYTDLTTAGPSITVPRGGIYVVEFGAQIYNASGGTNLASVKIGAAATSDVGAVQGPPVASPGASVSRSYRLTAAASDALKMQYKASSGTGQFSRRNLVVTPVRVA